MAAFGDSISSAPRDQYQYLQLITGREEPVGGRGDFRPFDGIVDVMSAVPRWLDGRTRDPDNEWLAGANEFARGVARMLRSAFTGVREIVYAGADAVGMTAETVSRATFNTRWSWEPWSQSANFAPGSTLTENVTERGTQYLKTVSTVQHWQNQYEYIVNPSAANAQGVQDSSASLLPFLGVRNGSPKINAPVSRGIWDLTPEARWTAVEQRLGKNLPGNFKTIDKFDQGIATSIKSLDLGAITYSDAAAITRVAQGYVNKVANYKGGTWNKITIDPTQITGRSLDLAVPPKGTAAKRRRAPRYINVRKKAGRSREHCGDLVMRHATAYQRHDGYYIHSESQTTSGVWVAAKPFKKLPSNVSPEELGATVEEAARRIAGRYRTSRKLGCRGVSFTELGGRQIVGNVHEKCEVR